MHTSGSRRRVLPAIVVTGMVVATVVGLANVAEAAGPVGAALSPAQVTALTHNADKNVIVLFKNQYGQLPAKTAIVPRQQAVRAAQAPVVR